MNKPNPDEITHALIIDEPWISKILRGEKTWELRTTHCQKRGWVGLIRKGSGQVVGIARVVGSRGPLTPHDLSLYQDAHRVPASFLQLKPEYQYAWEMADARPLATPVRYSHKSGAVIWVQLDPSVTEQIGAQLVGSAPRSSLLKDIHSEEVKMQTTTTPSARATMSPYHRTTATAGGRLSEQAEIWLGQRFAATRAPTKYIAGFDLGAGRQIAIERCRHSLMVWIDSVPAGLSGYRVVNRSNPGQPYQPSQDRNSNLRTVTPTLATGRLAYYLELNDLGVLERLVTE